MSYSPEQKAILLSLGIEELPPLHYSSDPEAEIQHHITEILPINQMPVPGRRCPNCLDQGFTVWVIPGKNCGRCGRCVS